MNSATSNEWYLLRSGPGDAARNMAEDAALLEAAPALGQPVLRFYSWTQPAATFGYFQKYAEIERLTLLRPLVRRPTGGGLVPHDADWTYSVALPPAAPWYSLKAAESYRRIHEWIQATFQSLGIPVELAASSHNAPPVSSSLVRWDEAPGEPAREDARPTEENQLSAHPPCQCFIGHEKSDVLWHGRKIAGAAQRRTRSGLLIQGSVQPPPGKLTRPDWERAMLEVAQSQQGITWADFQATADLHLRITELVVKTYSQDEYNQRR